MPPRWWCWSWWRSKLPAAVSAVRYRAILEYDGTDFLGFQRQAQGRTVQGTVEQALGEVGWTGKSLLGAGRTDTGVHAAGQVIAFDLEWPHGDEALRRALNAHLPADIAVRQCKVSEPGFHPRFAARARRYRYTLLNAPARSALRARYAWHIQVPLDLAALQAGARQIIGQHDFATFGTDPDGGTSTVRTVSQADWHAAGDELYFDIRADAFLYRMVRGLVGALKRVGAGDMPADDLGRRLAARDRSQCPPLAPAHGLCLMEVLY